MLRYQHAHEWLCSGVARILVPWNAFGCRSSGGSGAENFEKFSIKIS